MYRIPPPRRSFALRMVCNTRQLKSSVSNRPSFTRESLSEPHKLKSPNSGGHRAVVPPFLPPRPQASLLHNCDSPRHFSLHPFWDPFLTHPSHCLMCLFPSLNLLGRQVHRLLSQGEVSLSSPPNPSFLSPAMTTDLPSLCQLSFPFPPDTETAPAPSPSLRAFVSSV